MYEELRALFEADRQDHEQIRMAGTPEYDAMRARDTQRRGRALEILNQHPTLTPADLYHAAWLFNHGDTPDDAHRAHQLAEQAAQAGHAPARWLAAAAYDRWCMYRGLPQRYGTQIIPYGTGYRVWDTDPAVTDTERAAHDVPPLAEQHRRAAEDSRTLPQPPMELAPAWLKDALARWVKERS